MDQMKDAISERTSSGESGKDSSLRALLLMILFSLLLLAGDAPREQNANRDAIRDKPWGIRKCEEY